MSKRSNNNRINTMVLLHEATTATYCLRHEQLLDVE